MAKSTYYFEIKKVDAVMERNKQLMIEIKNLVAGSNSTADSTILGVYLRGRKLYVDMGILSEKDFVVENTGISIEGMA